MTHAVWHVRFARATMKMLAIVSGGRVAREGNALQRAVRTCDVALLEEISDHADAVYGHTLVHDLVVDPRPRDFVIAEQHLRAKRAENGMPALTREIVVGTFEWLVPVYER